MSDKDFKIEYPANLITVRCSHPTDRFPIAFASVKVDVVDGVMVGILCGMLRHPEYAGLVICKALVDKRIELCIAMGCDELYSSVYYKRTGLIKLYESYGFLHKAPLSKEYVRLVKEL